MTTGIEWTDETWNPTTGCDRVSPGCDHCYAATMAARLKGMGQPKYQTDGDPRTSGPGFGLAMHWDVVDAPLRWTKPRKVFVDSMSDLFHPKVTDEFLARVFAVMAMADRHTFQVLTKRPKRMRALLVDRDWFDLVDGALVALTGDDYRQAEWPLRNVWLGTSVEDQQRADERIPALLDTPAAVRFLSCEPLLGPVDLSRPLGVEFMDILDGYGHEMFATLQGRVGPDNGLHWVIVGGESGPGARPMHPAWARDIRDQCTAAGVAFLFKQWGAWAPAWDTTDESFELSRLRDDERVWPNASEGRWEIVRHVGKKAAGRLLDGRTWDEFPEPAEVTA